MIQLQYAEIQAESVADARERERELIQRSIDLLKRATQEDAETFALVEALHFTIRLWSSFLEDLADDNNELPKELRANLISIGIWILREAENIRQGESTNVESIIEVSEILKDGIK